MLAAFNGFNNKIEVFFQCCLLYTVVVLSAIILYIIGNVKCEEVKADGQVC